VKIEAKLMIILTVFFAAVTVSYWFVSYEHAGTTMLAFSGIFALVPGAYYWWWSRRMHPRPEDRNDATLSDGAGALGVFATDTIWPLVLAAGSTLIAVAFVFGVWLAIPGIGLCLLALVGVTAESRHRGLG
jgi:hypothetical protein